MKRGIFVIFLLLAVIGLVDAGYLTFKHYQVNNVLPCYINPYLPAFFSDCGNVLNSRYAVVFGFIPLALIGLIHYGILTLVIVLVIVTKKKFFRYWTLVEITAGAFASLYFVYLMVFIIQGFCQYCFLSALVSFVLFVLAYRQLETERKTIIIYSTGFIYQKMIKPVFFLIDPEVIHVFMARTGELLGSCSFCKWGFGQLLPIKNQRLKQTVAGIEFQNPVGLSAGFDYEAWLTQILPSLGFGFETVGTVINYPYEGNPPPRLGRLPKSKSLMVNKGFKSPGAKKIIEKLSLRRGEGFEIPIGISIGRTNSSTLKTQRQSIDDIIKAFILFEQSTVKHAYYELNISCPNLIHAGNINFYEPKKLEELLTALEKKHIKKPVFVKMPIEKSDKETLTALEVISQFKFVKGVIFGNLQKNRNDKSLDKNEVRKFAVGNFSGKPCEKRSNELIKLAYKNYGKKLVIIGCGGIFNTHDAYKKIKLGATLVQLITGMIYQGPQLVAQINLELNELLKKDGFKNIKEAIGINV